VPFVYCPSEQRPEAAKRKYCARVGWSITFSPVLQLNIATMWLAGVDRSCDIADPEEPSRAKQAAIKIMRM
jgi:hypothetical protein